MIKKIDKRTVERIASGQVITDLSSAIKELVENSLDAGAKKVEICLFQNGLDSFEVNDDGFGMGEAELQILGEAHATSKLSSFEDLSSGGLDTLGFRGEALYSLASLAGSVKVTSRTVEMAHGLQKVLQCPEGRLKACASSPGTKVRVEGLFQKYAVRLAEWKRDPQKSLSKVLKIVQSLAVAFPSVRFRLTSNTSSVLLATSGPGSHSAVLAELFGSNSKHLVAFDHPNAVGCFGRADAGRRSAPDRQFFFVNGHPSDQRVLQRALNEVYRSNGITDFPVMVVALRLSGDACDINLTPDKRSITVIDAVRLATELAALLQRLVFEGREQCPSQTRLPFNRPSILESSQTVTSEPSIESDSIPSAPSHIFPVPISSDVPLALLEQPVEDSLSKDDFARMEIIGQFNCGFILTRLDRPSGQGLLYIIDQHAADERIRLERLESTEKATSQSLVVPRGLELSVEDRLFITDRLDTFAELGFIIMHRDESLVLAAVPSMAGLTLEVGDLLDLVHALRENPVAKASLTLCPRVSRALASKACRSAVMIGAPLSFPQMSTIVRNLAGLDKPWICAHGRPTVRLLHAIQ